MDLATRRKSDEFWARRLACDPALLHTPGVHLLGPDPKADRPGLFFVEHEGTMLVRGEIDAAQLLTSRIDATPWLPGATLVRAMLGPRVDRILGPAFVGYATHAPVLPPGAGHARLVEAPDRVALARLRDAVTADEWEHAGLSSGSASAALVGVFEGDRLLAVAGFEILFGLAAHLGVLTHPAARGRGAGRRAVAATARLATERGLLLQYQTLELNEPSLRIAELLGFERYATSLAVRLVS